MVGEQLLISSARNEGYGGAALPSEPPVHRFLDRALPTLEQITTAVLLVLTLVQPRESRVGVSVWVLVLCFQAYSLGVHVLRIYVPRLHAHTWKHILDVPVAGLVYFIAADQGGPLFILFFLAVVCTAASQSLYFSLVYTAAVAILVALSDVALGVRGADDLTALAVRLILLALFGASTAILTRRFTLERAVARTAMDTAQRRQELNRLRADFTSTVSHDLRTPLTAARAALGLLETSSGERLDSGERGLLNNARRNIERLGILIVDLLATNQLEAGMLHIDRNLVDLRPIVTRVVGGMYPLIREKCQVLTLDVPGPLTVEGDARRLEQAIVNVLANANRHTSEGSRIAISVRVAAGEATLSVTDDGPGIPQAELENIFERFHRLAPAEVGSGLGLATARVIVELHGGRIWAESRPGQGSSFHIALPLIVTLTPQGGES